MMKKIFALLLSCALLFSLCACGAAQAPAETRDVQSEAAQTQAPTETQTPQETQNNIAKSAQESNITNILTATGVRLGVPERSENVILSYFDQENAPRIAELKFVVDGRTCAYRALVAPISVTPPVDISGLSCDWTSRDSAMLDTFSAELYWIEGQQGYISWYDFAYDIQYCATMDSGATKDLLVSLAKELYLPYKGNAGGDPSYQVPICTKSSIILRADLNGDGAEDKVHILEKTVDEFDSKEYGFSLEDGSGTTVVEDEMYISSKPVLWLADIDGDGLAEILFSGDCGSDDYISAAFKWDGIVLYRILFDGYIGGIAEGCVEDINDGVITIGAYCYVLGTYGGERDFTVTDTGSIAPVDGSIWSFENNEYQLVTVKELPVTVDGAESVLPVGAQICLTGFDGVGELFFVSGDGVQGSIHVSKDDSFWGWLIDGVAETEYFENIPYAG